MKTEHHDEIKGAVTNDESEIEWNLIMGIGMELVTEREDVTNQIRHSEQDTDSYDHFEIF